MAECDLWLMVDESGEYVVANEEGDLADLYDEKVGEGAGMARRIVHVVVNVPLPATVILRGTAPAEGEASLSVMA